MASLRELIQTAIENLDTYKNPDTTEVEARLSEILTAGGLGSITHDHLEALSFYNGMLHINTSYWVRGCSMSGDYKLPESVIDAEDPLTAVKVWAKEQRIAKAQAHVREAQHRLDWAKSELVKAEQSD